MRQLALGSLLVGLVVASVSLGGERSASACGGCFAPPPKTSQSPTQVAGHRMAFAISSKRTVLWDQIKYVGSPSEFGWVLPIRGLVDVGVSSDELFERLASKTTPVITAPPQPACPAPTPVCRRDCDDVRFGADSAVADTGSMGFDAGSVDVWSTSVVGPYEATQLSATDGSALRNWLKDHGYVLPDAIAPIVDQYVGEGFGFLAIKLVPKADATKMVPIRIGFDGGSPSLPLRMVAAGTGARVGIELFVLGEGRWETKNFPNGEVKTADLVWDWTYGGSNFGTLERTLLDGGEKRTWVTETSDVSSKPSLVAGLPPGTTTTEAGTVFSTITDESELEKAFPSRYEITVTRLVADLPSTALSIDLEIQASLGGKIPQSRQAPTGVRPYCPGPSTYLTDCPGITPTSEQCENGWKPGDPVAGDGGSSGSTFGCQANRPASQTALGIGVGAVALLGIGLVRRRRIR